jgi:cytochrome c peroxidase
MGFRKTGILFLLAAVIFIFQQCSKKDTLTGITTTTTTAGTTTTTTATGTLVLPNTLFNYAGVSYPAYMLPAMAATDNTPADNPITNDGATLGRVLFYDKNLSQNNTVSCGSCHKQTESFSDNSVLSTGFAGGLTARHSMPLLNVRFYKSGKMFWDERAATLEKQVLQPIQNHTEMGLTLAVLESKVQAQSYYPALFQKAFGSTEIDSVKIAKALAQFVRSIVTYQSKYDRVKQGTATFSPDEAAGEQLFMNTTPTCADCHRPPLFLTSEPAAPFALNDPNDLGINNENRFKVGSLRNAGMRTSLFHNGSRGNVQAMLTGAGGGPIPAHTVAPGDVQKLFAFINTLTDQTIATEEKFSTPFH